MRLELTRGEISVLIQTANENPDDLVIPVYQVRGVDSAHATVIINDLKEALSMTPGAYGHLINPDFTSNLDLLTACQKLKGYKVKAAPALKARSLPSGVQS